MWMRHSYAKRSSTTVESVLYIMAFIGMWATLYKVRYYSVPCGVKKSYGEP